MIDSRLARFVQIELEWAKRHDWPPRQYPQNEEPGGHKFWLMISGRAEVATDDAVFHLEPGMAFLITKWQYRRVVTITEPTVMLSLGFQSTLFYHLDLLQSLTCPVLWRPADDDWQRLHLWLMHLIEENRFFPEDRTTTLAGWGLATAIFGLCWQYLEAEKLVEPPPHELPSWLLGALQHIRTQPAESVTQWSRAVGFSPSQFRRLFQEHVGVTPQEYLKRLRLEEVQRLLAFSDLPISDIAAEVGYTSLSHFSRLFRDTLGLTPVQYRRSQLKSLHQRP
jgi:AraC-like DNA-binding protein